MQKTPQLGLNKPDLNDYVDIADINENMDILDDAVGNAKEGLAAHLAERATESTLGHVKVATEEDGTLLLEASNISTTGDSNVQTEIDILKQSGNEGKSLLETTLISKNAEVSKSGDVVTFQELNDGIRQLRDKKMVIMFYDNGNEHIELTGGWVEGYSSGAGVLSKEADHLYVEASGGVRIYGTNQPFDFSEIETLYVEWEDLGSGTLSNRTRLVISDDKSANDNGVAMEENQARFDRKVTEIDVSSLGMEYFIKVVARPASGYISKLKVYKIWGEGQ